MASPKPPAKLFLLLLAQCRHAALDALALYGEVLQPLLDWRSFGDRRRSSGGMLLADSVKTILEGGVVGSRCLLLGSVA